jgi:hypothetical protein
LENTEENSEKIWKMRKKSRLNCEMIWKIWKISVLVKITPKETSSSDDAASAAALLHRPPPPPSSSSPPPPPPLSSLYTCIYICFSDLSRLILKVFC